MSNNLWVEPGFCEKTVTSGSIKKISLSFQGRCDKMNQNIAYLYVFKINKRGVDK